MIIACGNELDPVYRPFLKMPLLMMWPAVTICFPRAIQTHNSGACPKSRRSGVYE
jgi:hypothetical protein